MQAQFRNLLDSQIERGWHTASQLAIFHRGTLKTWLCAGAASYDSRFIWFSATKSLTAIAALILCDRGLLHLGDKISSYWPEFGTNGKDDVTVTHLLSHQGGFPVLPKEVSWRSLGRWDEVCRGIARMHTSWPPGTDVGYHPVTSGFVLGELIRRVDGRMPRTFLEDEIFEPLGMQASLGLTDGQSFDLVLPEARSERTWQDPEGKERRTTDIVQRFRMRATLEAQIPSANGIGNALALAKFYAMLERGGSYEERRYVSTELLSTATRVHASSLHDRATGMPSSFGLGFLVGGPFEPFARSGVFGHTGQQSVISYADPRREIAVAYLTNGLQSPQIVQARTLELVEVVDAAFPLTVSYPSPEGHTRRA